MPTGIIINGLSIIGGGIAGTVIGHKLSHELKESLTMVFAICAMAMGINSIVLMKNMPAVILAVVIGTAIGIIIHLGNKINVAAVGMQKVIGQFIKNDKAGIPEDEFMNTLVTVIVLFCTSGTGIYGSIVSGMSGDHSILISKSILDFFTAMIFACNLGAVVSAIAIPQIIIFLLLFLGAGMIYPMTTPDMISDFKACGGFLMLATSFRMMKVKKFPTADMIPSMLIVMPISWLWNIICQVLI